MRAESNLTTSYDQQVQKELSQWQKRMQKKPSFLNRFSKTTQERINRIIPEKIHGTITTAIKQMTRALIFGIGITSSKPLVLATLQEREAAVLETIRKHRNTATAEGAITGAGGLLLGLADFPIWLTIKMKMLFDIAALYGVDVKDYKERIYLLHIFQLTFSSQQHRNRIYTTIANWEKEKLLLPNDTNQFDWRSFQQEYRDYIDIAKLLQLVPGIGAVVGAYVNHRLTAKLGKYAMNAFRMRMIPSL
ncbi:EcsC family protein [Ohtaekwangia koreensis]|uniref:EcsC protein family protein n=1 Tax=Ohtaekwangia koreensis TaxID=688867 RepID=A0A1T5M7B0_9BACT|nr:EcsC family protein [Ohtaekwangia koreensis]SKC84121.1 EcsC protein family protein [Ohtaekwangia koreensis]